MKLWCAVLLTALLGLSGCGPRPKTPAELLPGTWMTKTGAVDVTITFVADGTTRWHIQDHSLAGWLVGMDVRFSGRWRVDGQRLHMETIDPPFVFLFSGFDKSFPGDQQIHELDEDDLVISEVADPDHSRIHFRRVAPAGR
ncbi:MAG TPA: hypothetical protein VM165_07670 [Planctomycetaceae bacterium]|nr:hypothetical protein [Planctomycetaceae bacterium]